MTEQKRNEIVTRWRGGASIRRIASDLRLARNTVSGVLAQVQAQRAGSDAAPPSRRRSRQPDPSDPLPPHLLAYPRRQLPRFVEAQAPATTVADPVRAFGHLRGGAATCLYDNQKVVVTGREDGVPIYNARFLAFATHYGFRPVACRPRRPQTKGKVERPFAYVESSLFNGRTFETLNHLNETTAWWLAHVADVRELRELRKTPLQLHEEGRSFLLPLPAQPYEIYPVLYRTVSVQGLITYRQNHHSVPC